MLVGTPDCFESPPPNKNPMPKSSHQFSTSQKSWIRKFQTQIKPPSFLSLHTQSTVQYPPPPRDLGMDIGFHILSYWFITLAWWLDGFLPHFLFFGKEEKPEIARLWNLDCSAFSSNLEGVAGYLSQIMSLSFLLLSIHYTSSCGMQSGPPLLPYLPMTMDQHVWTQKLPCRRAAPPSLWRQRHNYTRQGSRFPWSILFKKNRRV